MTLLRLISHLGMLLISTVVVGAAWIVSSIAYFPLTTVDFDDGREIFEDRCASCHAIDQRGGPEYGPNLASIGAVAANRVEGMSAEQYLAESILKPDAFRGQGVNAVMPADISAGLSREEVLSIAGFLGTLGGSPNSRRLADMIEQVAFEPIVEQQPPRFDDAQDGKRIYFGKGGCIQCHPLLELPGFDLRAPSLLHAGRHDAKYLAESILDPSKAITPGYDAFQVLHSSGIVHSGRLLRDAPESIELLTEDQRGIHVLRIAKSQIESDDKGQPVILRASQSAMPTPSKDALSVVEIEQIVAFLETLQ